MRIFTIMLLAGLGLSACGKQGELEALEKKACACKDKKCGEEVAKEIEKVTESMKEGDVNQETAKTLGAIAMCLMKLEGIGIGDEK